MILTNIYIMKVTENLFFGIDVLKIEKISKKNITRLVQSTGTPSETITIRKILNTIITR